MRKEGKNPAVIAAEREEAQHLAKTILSMTERIPSHVINTPGVMYAQQFKAAMAKARAVANASTKNLAKLRAAMQDVNFYYRPSAGEGK